MKGWLTSGRSTIRKKGATGETSHPFSYVTTPFAKPSVPPSTYMKYDVAITVTYRKGSTLVRRSSNHLYGADRWRSDWILRPHQLLPKAGRLGGGTRLSVVLTTPLGHGVVGSCSYEWCWPIVKRSITFFLRTLPAQSCFTQAVKYCMHAGL